MSDKVEIQEQKLTDEELKAAEAAEVAAIAAERVAYEAQLVESKLIDTSAFVDKIFAVPGGTPRFAWGPPDMVPFEGEVEITIRPNDGRDRWNNATKQWLPYVGDPDVVGLTNALWDDPLLKDLGLQLIGLQSVIERQLPDGAIGITKIQDGWQRFKKQLDAINPSLGPYIENKAREFRVPIIPL